MRIALYDRRSVDDDEKFAALDTHTENGCENCETTLDMTDSETASACTTHLFEGCGVSLSLFCFGVRAVDRRRSTTISVQFDRDEQARRQLGRQMAKHSKYAGRLLRARAFSRSLAMR